MKRIQRWAASSFADVRLFSWNVKLMLLASILTGIGYGIFSVDFNLYILSLGIDPGGLGQVLSAGPFAQILAAIPIGFIAELIGFRKAFLVIYGLSGLAQLLEATAPTLPLISAGAFIGGLAGAGSFVVKLPFLNANCSPEQRTHVFSVDGLLQGATVAFGALLGGYVPNWVGSIVGDPAVAYRYTLYVAGFCTLLATLPVMLLRDQKPVSRAKISLSPYLWGMDHFTRVAALVEFFIGLTMGLIVPFMNLYFIFHLGVSREFYSSVEALVWIPTVFALSIGPLLVARFGSPRTVTGARALVPLFPLVMAITTFPLLGASAYWSYRALASMSQSLWFALAMSTATPRSRTALSAWLEITYQFGVAIAALLTGAFLVQSNYLVPFLLSAGSGLLTVGLTHWLITVPIRRAQQESQIASQNS